MSWVSTVTIQMGGFMESKTEALSKLNEWLKENDHLGCKFEFIDSRLSAGTKSPECRLIWGGFNYLNVDEFITFFHSLKLDNSLLTICRPDYGGFCIVPSKVDTPVDTSILEAR